MELPQKLIRSSNIDPNLYAKYQNPRSRGSQDIVLTNFSLFAIMAESKKGHKLVNISWNSLKRYSGPLNIDPNLHDKCDRLWDFGPYGGTFAKFSF